MEEMKTCYECKKPSPLESYPNKKKSRDGKDPRCRPCFRAYHRNIYHNTSYRKSQIRQANSKNVDNLKIWLRNYKLERGCTDCGYKVHSEALQFDHLKDKIGNVGEMVHRGASKSKILAEIAKCEVVCANCHAIRTYNRRGL